MEAISCKHCIKAKYLTGVIEGGSGHHQTINKGRSFILGFLDRLEQVKGGGNDLHVAVGEQDIAGVVSFHESSAGEHRLLPANIG